MHGMFWSPANDPKLKDMNDYFLRADNIDKPHIYKWPFSGADPPTYFRTNEVTATFQLITDTYGVPDYKEVNPSLFGIVTFPFLFGVMFGDIGHGFILFLAGFMMCYFADRLKASPIGEHAGMRYMVLMMGFFATFNGICYNDFMSIPIDGGSCYTDVNGYVDWEPNCVYPIGFDPKWYMAEN